MRFPIPGRHKNSSVTDSSYSEGLPMNKRQKSNRSFRSSKIWKEFRHKKHVEQNGLDPITKTKLTKQSNLHHKKRDLDENEYQDISNPSNFVFLLHDCHKVLHWCLRYVKKYHDLSVLDRLYEEVKVEAILNGYISEE